MVIFGHILHAIISNSLSSVITSGSRESLSRDKTFTEIKFLVTSRFLFCEQELPLEVIELLALVVVVFVEETIVVTDAAMVTVLVAALFTTALTELIFNKIFLRNNFLQLIFRKDDL